MTVVWVVAKRGTPSGDEAERDTRDWVRGTNTGALVPEGEEVGLTIPSIMSETIDDLLTGRVKRMEKEHVSFPPNVGVSLETRADMLVIWKDSFIEADRREGVVVQLKVGGSAKVSWVDKGRGREEVN